MAVTTDTSASNVSVVNNNAVSTTMTPGVLTNACAVVIVSWENSGAVTVSSVKLDATTAFTRFNGVTSTMDGSPCGMDMWYLVGSSLTNASHTFDVTMSGNTAAKFMVVATWGGVNQTTPLAGFVSTVVDTTSPTTISPTGGTSSEQMMGALMNVDGAGTQTPAVGSNTTILGAVRKETAFDGAVFIGGFGAGNAASLNFTYVGVIATECIGAVVKAAAASGIAFDAAANSGYQAAQSTYTFNRTCTGTNLFLTVDVELLSVPGTTVTSVKDDSAGGNVSMVFIGARSTLSGAGRVECWGLANPTTGTKSIQVNLSATIASSATATSYTGVNQTTPTESFNSAQATNVGAADASVVITSESDNCWIHAACVSDDASITANQTTRNNVTGALGSGANEDNNAQVTPAGTTTMSYTNIGALATWAIAGYAIIPLADKNFYSLYANSGSYSVTGDVASVPAARGLTANTGSYAISGNSAVVSKGRSLAANSGSYAISGTAATNQIALSISAAAGTYSLAGVAASLVFTSASAPIVSTSTRTDMSGGGGAGFARLQKRRIEQDEEDIALIIHNTMPYIQAALRKRN